MDAIIARLSALTLTNLATTALEAVGIESVERGAQSTTCY